LELLIGIRQEALFQRPRIPRPEPTGNEDACSLDCTPDSACAAGLSFGRECKRELLQVPRQAHPVTNFQREGESLTNPRPRVGRTIFGERDVCERPQCAGTPPPPTDLGGELGTLFEQRHASVAIACLDCQRTEERQRLDGAFEVFEPPVNLETASTA